MSSNQAWPMGRDASGRFLKGGPGRPVGTRNRMSARAARLLLGDFMENEGELLPRMRRWFLPQYLALIGRMLPREVDELEAAALDLDELGPDELAALAEAVSAAVGRRRSEADDVADAEGGAAGEADGEAAAAATEDAA